MSNVFRDQADHPLDRAVFWSEYVIRHNGINATFVNGYILVNTTGNCSFLLLGAKHLRSAGRELNFFQYHSIDVIALLAAGLLFSLWLLSKTVKLTFYLLYCLLSRKSKLRVEITKKKK